MSVAPRGDGDLSILQPPATFGRSANFFGNQGQWTSGVILHANDRIRNNRFTGLKIPPDSIGMQIGLVGQASDSNQTLQIGSFQHARVGASLSDGFSQLWCPKEHGSAGREVEAAANRAAVGRDFKIQATADDNFTAFCSLVEFQGASEKTHITNGLDQGQSVGPFGAFGSGYWKCFRTGFDTNLWLLGTSSPRNLRLSGSARSATPIRESWTGVSNNSPVSKVTSPVVVAVTRTEPSATPPKRFGMADPAFEPCGQLGHGAGPGFDPVDPDLYPVATKFDVTNGDFDSTKVRRVSSTDCPWRDGFDRTVRSAGTTGRIHPE